MFIKIRNFILTGYFFRQLKTAVPKPHLLVLTKSKALSTVYLIFIFIVLILFYSFLAPSINTEENWQLWLIYLIPIPAAPEIIRLLRIVITGDRLEVDKQLKIISKNHQKIADFKDVNRIQVRTIYDYDTQTTYRVSIVLKSGKKINVQHSSNKNEIIEAADDLADFLDVSIGQKE